VAGGGSSGPRAWAKTGRAPRPCRCWGQWISTASCSFSATGPTAPRARAKALGLDYLAGKKLGDLVDAEARATAQTLFKNGRPVRQIHLARVDEFHMGALMMHFMLETIIMGRLMGVDPFDQPGVEEAKVLTRQYLAEK
jgi:glucose-6-phosphate isomerase